MRFSLFFICTLALLGAFGYAHAATQPHVGFAPESVWFSKDPFFAGDDITLFTFVINCREEKIEGTVSFLNNKETIAEAPFSLQGGCDAKVVRANWQVPEGEHAISAEISRAIIAESGEDMLLVRSSLSAITRVAKVDTDGDGVPDDVDADDDNDGITDKAEIAQNTDPLNSDTDGDGTPDNKDAQPLVKATSTTEQLVRTTKEIIGSIAPSATTTKSVASRARAALESFRTENADRFEGMSESLAQKRVDKKQKGKQVKEKIQTEEKIYDEDEFFDMSNMLAVTQGGFLVAGQYAASAAAYIFNVQFLFYLTLAIILFIVSRRIFKRLRALVRGRPEGE